jgi:hypothetical protein
LQIVVGNHFVPVISGSVVPDKSRLGENNIWMFDGLGCLACNDQAILAQIIRAVNCD